MKNKFTWGDPIIIVKNAPEKFNPGEFGSVCGFYKVVSEIAAKEFECSIGDWIYTVEFQEGNDMQIPEIYLEKFEFL